MQPWLLSWAGITHSVSAPLRAVQAHRLVRGECFVSLTIDGPVVEIAEPMPWWRRGASRTTSLTNVRQLGSIMARDRKVKGMLVELRSLRAGTATATSLRAALVRLREAGKTVVVYLPMGAGSRELLVASAATTIIMGNASSILPLGVAVEARYFRRVLDKIGVLPEIFARGEFKTAGESLARDSMSAEQRQQLEAILDTLESELVAGLSQGRRLSPDHVRALIDGGPYRAPDAVQRGLVDAAGYDDELPRRLAPLSKKPARIVSAGEYLRLRRRPHGRKRIGIVHVRGPIVSRGPVALGRMAIDEKVIGALRRAGSAKNVPGVVVVIDSPGGSVLASDRIYHEVVRLAEKKPVVAYFANIAASGGYYVAAGAHAIVAQPTTITGSIGVVAAHLVLSPLFEKLGIVTELVKRGARADMLSASRPLDEGERQAMTLEIDGYYRDFVDIVARGRGRPADEIEKLARGRVYSGLEAHRVGLVDRLGDLDAALDLVRERLGVDQPIAPLVIKPPRTMPKPPEVPAPFVEILEAFESSAAFRALGGEAARDVAALALNVVPSERVLAWSELVLPV
jgi:protease IV